MHRSYRMTMAVVGVAALAACGSNPPAEVAAPPPAPPSAAPSPSPSAAPTTVDPDLKNADLSQLKNYDLDLGVPVVITTSLDAGPAHYLGAQPDGSVDLSGTAVTESTRMKLKPAKVRKRTEETMNRIVIVAAPVVAASGPELCVTDIRRTVLAMRPCRPGATDQAWRLVPAGDSGLFELEGRHTAIEYDDGKIVKEGGWSAFETAAVAG